MKRTSSAYKGYNKKFPIFQGSLAEVFFILLVQLLHRLLDRSSTGSRKLRLTGTKTSATAQHLYSLSLSTPSLSTINNSKQLIQQKTYQQRTDFSILTFMPDGWFLGLTGLFQVDLSGFRVFELGATEVHDYRNYSKRRITLMWDYASEMRKSWAANRKNDQKSIEHLMSASSALISLRSCSISCSSSFRSCFIFLQRSMADKQSTAYNEFQTQNPI